MILLATSLTAQKGPSGFPSADGGYATFTHLSPANLQTEKRFRLFTFGCSVMSLSIYRSSAGECTAQACVWTTGSRGSACRQVIPGRSQPRSWLRPALVFGSGLLVFVGFTVSPGLCVAFAARLLVVWVGTFTRAARTGLRRTRSLREAGEKPDLRYLERRLHNYSRMILLCFVGAAVGCSSPHPVTTDPRGHLILALVLMGAALVTICVCARVVLPRQPEHP